ncbi:MAG: hypothetical protein HYV16_04635 [Gammaproteobacteria bacterium]|nr:hypothetical protein [Gammaproteobacteria bacterium]
MDGGIVKPGSLVIVGCGLHPGQMTLEAKSHIEHADVVLAVVPAPLSYYQLSTLTTRLESMTCFYDGRPRPETYAAMTARMVECVKEGKQVCAVFYGHPGVFVTPSHAALRQLREEGYSARMLPGISADACLIADLGVDPAEHGCQSYETTSFLLTQRFHNPEAALILWQVGLAGELSLKSFKPGQHGLDALVQVLGQWYEPEHRVCLYEAPILPTFAPRISWLCLCDLPNAELKEYSTLFVPPRVRATLVEERLTWLDAEDADLQAYERVPMAELSPERLSSMGS